MLKEDIKAYLSYIKEDNLFTEDQLMRMQILPWHDLVTCIWLLSDAGKTGAKSLAEIDREFRNLMREKEGITE